MNQKVEAINCERSADSRATRREREKTMGAVQKQFFRAWPGFGWLAGKIALIYGGLRAFAAG